MLNADESILHRDEEESGHSGKIIESAVEKGAGQELRSHEPRDSPAHVCGIGSGKAWAQLGEEDEEVECLACLAACESAGLPMKAPTCDSVEVAVDDRSNFGPDFVCGSRRRL